MVLTGSSTRQEPTPLSPPDFRAEAVHLVRSTSAVPTVAKDLGVNQQTLRNWLRQTDIDKGRRHYGSHHRGAGRAVQAPAPGSRCSRRKGQSSQSQRLLRQRNRPEQVDVFRFMDAEKANHKVQTMSRVLQVSSSGFHAWHGRCGTRFIGVARRKLADHD
jgi:transposase-like protein